MNEERFEEKYYNNEEDGTSVFNPSPRFNRDNQQSNKQEKKEISENEKK